MESAFGVEHGEIEKFVNPLRALKGAQAGKRAASTGTPIFDQLAAKHGISAAAGSGGGQRVAAAAGKRKGSYKLKSFNPFGGGGRRRA